MNITNTMIHITTPINLDEGYTKIQRDSDGHPTNVTRLLCFQNCKKKIFSVPLVRVKLKKIVIMMIIF